MDDESVTRFKNEARRLKEAGGPSADVRRNVVYSLGGVALFALWLAGLMALTRFFPREANGAMGLRGLSLVCGLNLFLATLLWRWRTKDWFVYLASVLLAGSSGLILAAYLIDRLR